MGVNHQVVINPQHPPHVSLFRLVAAGHEPSWAADLPCRQHHEAKDRGDFGWKIGSDIKVVPQFVPLWLCENRIWLWWDIGYEWYINGKTIEQIGFLVS